MTTRQTKRAETAEAKALQKPVQRKPLKETASTAGRKKGTAATKPAATVVVDGQAAAASKGKLGDLLAALKQKGGTGLGEISEALGWQPHTTRAAITRLRQRGFDIVLEGDRGARCYRLQSKA